MSATYVTKTGGNVIIESSHLAHERRFITDELRNHLRQDQRSLIIRQLEEKTGLPFDLAITNIESWKETETEWEPWANFHRPHDEQPIVFITKCYVRGVEYPILLDSNPTNT